MNSYHDPELEDVLQDDELRRLASILSSTRRPEPPLDDAFRTSLRRQLIQEAWVMSEGRASWWRRAFAPPGLAWAGATAGLLLIAAVVVYATLQPNGPLSTVVVNSSMDGSKSVALAQPILVSFNQPMDHQSTEQAVQITPATTVTYSWDSNTLTVQPATGNLAPNTQYQVTIGPTAKTASGQPLTEAHTITFVTQPPATPAPTPTPRPTPTSNSLLTGEKQLASLSGGAKTVPAVWSADSSSIYFVDASGALKVVPAKGGDATVVAPVGASSPAVAPAGDRLAYVRGNAIEVLTFASGKTAEVAVTPAPVQVGWSKDSLIWTAKDGIYTQAASGSTRITSLPADATVMVLSLSPDGTHAVYKQDQNLFVLDLGTGKSTQLGQASAAFLGWSPGGTLVLYTAGAGVIVADMQGTTQATLAGGEPSFSSQDAVLLGGDTELDQVRPDGSGAMKLASGTYHAPVWAPNGSVFLFFRGGALWVASAPALPAEPTAVDEASSVVNDFMQARLKGASDQASALLDSNGKQAYAGERLKLTLGGDPHFSRYYVLTQELVSTQPDTARFVVRLVLTKGKIDVSDFEETLTLVRDASSKHFLVDQATGGAKRDLGKGAEVVSVEVAADTIKITFDSDLDPGTVIDGVFVLDSKGNKIDATTSYAGRVVTMTGLQLKPGRDYRLVVLPTLRDVRGQNVASEYDLDVVGPTAKNRGDHKQTGSVASPSPAQGQGG